MGAQGSQQSWTADVCLDHPQGCDGSVKFAASASTAREGSARYQDLCVPWRMELSKSDVIMVVLQTSDPGFFQNYASEFAELYLPWWLLLPELHLGKEVAFDLALEPAAPRLGRQAMPDAYEAAFNRARKLGSSAGQPSDPKATWWSENRSAPALQMRVRLTLTSEPMTEKLDSVPVQGPAASPPLREHLPEPGPSTGTDALDVLSQDDMRLLFQLQVKNSELRSQLNLADEDVPQVEAQTEEFVDQLRQVVLEGQKLRSELQTMEQELPKVAAQLTEAQLASLEDGDELPPANPPQAPAPQRSSAELMEQVQQVTRQTIELSSSYEDRIQRLDAELRESLSNQRLPEGTAPEWMLQQLQVLEANCEALESFYSQAQEHRKQLESRVLHRLRSEVHSQLREIGGLKDIIRHAEENEPPPGIEPLKEEAAQLQEELRRVRELRTQGQVRAEQQSAALRRELGDLQDQCQQALLRRSKLEKTVEDLKNSHSNFASNSRELLELKRDKEFLDKERLRMERRITILDEKISSLQEEAEDLRQRACVVMSAVPEQPAASCDAEVWQLQDTLQQKQLKVQELRRKDSRAERDKEAARQELEAAQVDASVLERKIRHLRSRTPLVQAGA